MRSPEAIAAQARSVADKIKAFARNRREDPMQVQARFVLERFLARLAASSYADHVALKGGMLFLALSGEQERPTHDADLHLDDAMDAPTVTDFITAVAATELDEEDGIVFDCGGIKIENVRDGIVPGYRVRFDALIQTPRPSRVSMKIDLAWGGAPGYMMVEIPCAIRGFAPATVRACTWQNMVAEKLHAITRHGAANTRMKDYHDLTVLSRTVAFNGHDLCEAVRETFTTWGNTPVLADPPGLAAEWGASHERDWQNFRRNKVLKTDIPTLTGAVDEIRQFALPVLEAVANDQTVDVEWLPGTGWSSPAPIP